MRDLIAEFDALRLKTARVIDFHFLPHKRFQFRCYVLGRGICDPEGGKEYHLVFHRIFDYEIDMRGWFWTVEHQEAFYDTPLLEATRNNIEPVHNKADPRDLIHYHLRFDCGQIDIIAESFYCGLIYDKSL